MDYSAEVRLVSFYLPSEIMALGIEEDRISFCFRDQHQVTVQFDLFYDGQSMSIKLIVSWGS